MDKFEELDGLVDIITVIKIDNQYKWYCCDKFYWVLDYTKYEPNNTNYSSRFGIGILNESTVYSFMEQMTEYSCSYNELQQLLLKCMPVEWFDEIQHLFPKMFIDFDEKKLYSIYSEQLLETYVPDGWEGLYQDFKDLIPSTSRYWIVDGVDYEQIFV